MKTWKWRLAKLDIKIIDFAEKIKIPQTTLSAYLSGKLTPSLSRYDEIEKKLQELENSNKGE